jgi:hypothetical protein
MVDMKNEPENLTAQESLDIITSMIRQAKGNAQRNSFHFLLWGWVVIVANIGMYTLANAGFERPYLIWLITIPAWITSFVVGYKNRKEERVSTHFDNIHLALWTCFGVCVFTVVTFGSKLNYQINPLVTIMSFIPTFISGLMMKFRPLMIGGVCLWIFGVIGLFTPIEYQPVVGAIGIFFGYLVPGYILRAKKA